MFERKQVRDSNGFWLQIRVCIDFALEFIASEGAANSSCSILVSFNRELDS